MTGEMQISLGLTCFQFAFALLLLSSHTLLEISGSGRLRSPLMHVVNRVKIIVSTRPSRDGEANWLLASKREGSRGD